MLGGAAAITPYAMRMVFTGFLFLEFEKLYVIRWLRATPTFSNRWVALAVGGSVVWQLDVLYTPLDQYFGTVPFGLEDWEIIATALAVGLPAYLAIVLAIRRYFPLDEGSRKNSHRGIGTRSPESVPPWKSTSAERINS